MSQRGSSVTLVEAMSETGHENTAIGILDRRLRTQKEEVDEWASLALRLTTSRRVIRSGHMTSYHWKTVATTYAPRFTREIALAIFETHADRATKTWFINHSDAESVLRECIEQKPALVWEVLSPFLSPAEDGQIFAIGLPRDVLEAIPAEMIEAWIDEDPVERAIITSNLVVKDVSTDDTLCSKILGKYGDNKDVSNAFYGQFISGSWAGAASDHWLEIASALERTAKTTKLRRLRKWALSAIASLKEMATRDRQREEEESL